MDDVIFLYDGTNGQNQAWCYVVRQVAAPVDVTGHGPLHAAHWPTSSASSLAVAMGTRRLGRGAPVTTLSAGL